MEEKIMLVDVKNLVKYFPVKMGFFSRDNRYVHAVDDIDIEIKEQEVTGLVGESGCGKSTVGRILIGLMRPTSGRVRFLGRDIFDMDDGEELRRMRKDMQIIFQDPYASLNPRKTIRQILSRPYLIHGLSDREEIEDNILQLLERTGLTPPHRYLDRYPHEFSGGQRQRIAIGRALSLKPKFVVADEPVSSLDISLRAQVLNLMKELGEDFDTTYLFISHDLGVVRSFCDQVLVMYLGKIVESSNVETLFLEAEHPYTKSLLSATPIPHPKTRDMDRIVLKGDVPSPIDIPKGCRFNTRCPFAMPICREEEPKLERIDKDHQVACHLVN
jgi:peptide/nickel transport system ATP-binding protein/oligopeptide transport system ATP-binding protein